MSGIFGLINLDGRPVEDSSLQRMQGAMSFWGPDGADRWCSGAAGLGQLRLHSTPEAHCDLLPRWEPELGLAFTAAARIDNRDELCAMFDIALRDRAQTPDGELVLRAYLRWGEESPKHLLGDWSFAIWHPAERRLFLARDHYGITSLYYFQDAHRFAFASSRKALYALGAPRRLNELYLAQMLMAWPAYQGQQTIDLDLRRLPPAHALTLSPAGVALQQYWRLEDTPELRLPTFQAYVEGLLEVYNTAVGARLRTNQPVGLTLSGGLDSGSVAALAARQAAAQGQRLAAFTSVPLFDAGPYLRSEQTIGDESSFAAATAHYAGNIDLSLLKSAATSPLDGIRQLGWVHDEPLRGAGNAYWIADLLRQAHAAGVRVLLTGQSGNGTISWTGAVSSLPFSQRVARLGLWRALRLQLGAWAPGMWKLTSLRGERVQDVWRSRAALNPAFVERVGLLDAIRHEQVHPMLGAITDPRQQRLRIIKPGRSTLGALWAELAAAAQLDIRDPTADVRLLRYCIAVPDRFFWGPTPQDDRWLIRSAMVGWLPDPVRLTHRRGRQAADLLPRLRTEAGEVSLLLNRMAASPAADYFDFPRLQNLWHRVQNADTPESLDVISAILLRSLSGGIFLCELADAWETPDSAISYVHAAADAAMQTAG